MKKTIAVLIVLTLSLTLLAGCADIASTLLPKQSDAALEPKPETNSETVSEPEAAIDYGYNDYTADDYPLFSIPIPESDISAMANGILLSKDRDLVNPFDAYNDENVEKIPYTDIVPLSEYLETTEFGYNFQPGSGELKLFQGAETAHMGWLGDVLVGDITLVGETMAWNFRAETLDQAENRSGIILPNPENMAHIEDLDRNQSKDDPDSEWPWQDEYIYDWFEDCKELLPGQFQSFQMFIIYFPESHHQYTFYAKALTVDEEGNASYKHDPRRLVETFGAGYSPSIY